MIDPVFIELGPITIRWYGVMMALGFIAALMNWTALGRKEGKDMTFCSDLLFWIMISGIVGARVAYVIANIGFFIQEPLMIVRLDKGGLIYYGGFIGAFLAVYIFSRSRKLSVAAMYDFTATSVPLSHALGRIGCYLNGCCFGKHGSFWPGDVCPVQLMESAYNMALYMLLVLLYKRKKRDGFIAVVYLLVYPFGRFLFELLRGDERMRIAGLSIAQIISILLFSGGLMLLAVLQKRSGSGNK